MQLQQLKYLAAVIEHKSFSKAAQNVHISQPSLSQSIQALEDELGFKLLNRTHEGSFPTAMGQLVYNDIKEILAFVDSKTANWQKTYQKKSALNGLVRIACMPAVYPLFTESILNKLNETYPNLKCKVQEARNNILFSYLTDNETDLVLCGFMRPKQAQVLEFAKKNGLEMIALKEDAYKIALGEGHKLFAQNDITAKAAKDLPLACYSDSDDVAGMFFEKYFAQQNCVGYNSFEKIIRAALSNKTASVLPELATQSILKFDTSYKGKLNFVTVEGFYIPFTHYLCHRKNAKPVPELDVVKNMIVEAFKRL